MTSSPVSREAERLSALDEYDVLDTPREEAFDRITRLVRRIFDVPISTVTFLDAHRQWFKSPDGLSVTETARDIALCDVVIRAARPLIVNDTLRDDRFRENPSVVGPPHLRFYAGAPLATSEGQVIGTLCAMDTKPRAFEPDEIATLSDLAGIVMDGLELRRLASHDSLTKALSRRAFRSEMDRALALAVRHRHELSCIMVDLDRFKEVNTRHGHAAGDAVLAQSVAAMRAGLRESDLIGRVGGEEFAILLPLTARDAAVTVAEKLRAAIADQTVTTEAGSLSVTASFGIASLDRSATDTDTLLRCADEALYAAKESGRNRCVAWLPKATLGFGMRRRVLKAGKISFNGGNSSIDCTIRTLSDDGAGFDVTSTAGIPESFKLAIEADGFSRFCQIAEKRERHVEVRFT